MFRPKGEGCAKGPRLWQTAILTALAAYSATLSLLSAVTAINSFAGFPMSRFFGDGDFTAVVLAFLPGENPYHMQKWIAAPCLNTIAFSMLAGLLVALLRFGVLQDKKAVCLRRQLLAGLVGLGAFALLYRHAFATFVDFLFVQ